MHRRLDSGSWFAAARCLQVAGLIVAAASGAHAQPSTAAAAPLWRPTLADTWDVRLAGAPDASLAVSVHDTDLDDTSAAAIAALRAAGRRVVCYFSAGSAEQWRADFAQFQPADLGKPLSGWPGEFWIDTRSANVRQIMRARLDLARDKGCDGVDPDNVDGYANPTGLPLSPATQLDYNRFLAAEAHARGLAVGLKNDVEQLAELAPDFDFAINEQCNEYRECAGYAPAFVAQGKPVVNIEYRRAYVKNTRGARDKLCADMKALGVYTLVMSINLDGSIRIPCQP
jgi:hypothetical protein